MGTIAMSDSDLHLPRILCLHGGGVTAEIFRLQSRALLNRLRTSFRLVFADGPFLCSAGPGIVPVYADLGPYRRWLRWLPHEHAEVDAGTAVEEVRYQIEAAMAEDDRLGADGAWVGVMGFSQGAKVAASMLFESQRRRAIKERGGGAEDVQGFEGDGVKTLLWEQDWRFGVLMAGRAPLVSLAPGAECEWFQNAGECDDGTKGLVDVPREWKLTVPTLHVHGLKDNGLHLHRRLSEHYCPKDRRIVVEWDGDHRVPIKSKDVELVCEKLVEVARMGGVEPGYGITNK
ncbi:citrinin biosynthesis oxidoreductase-like protein CtnB [Phyllosticta citribraziliensis]|uniref:Citrinin biosynthesis oxidoreductase-like protein CtnB n=1 Tax=Phyllosticta citribraziliensis TaxID=989973 RepID=A0ABR1M540_9PEZI